MNASIEQPAAIKNTKHYFGGCPDCGEQNGYVNVRSDHWAVCDVHKTKWPIGSNLFSCWHDETEDLWRRNANLLASYREVRPLRCADEIDAAVKQLGRLGYIDFADLPF